MRNLGWSSLDYSDMKVTKVLSIFVLYFLCVKIIDSKDLQYFSSFKFGEVDILRSSLAKPNLYINAGSVSTYT